MRLVLQRQPPTLNDSKRSHDYSQNNHPQQHHDSLDPVSKTTSIKDRKLASFAQLTADESHNRCHDDNEHKDGHGLHALFLVGNSTGMGGFDLEEVGAIGQLADQGWGDHVMRHDVVAFEAD